MLGELKTKHASLKENWGNKGVILILNNINLSLFYVDFQEKSPLNHYPFNVNTSYQRDLKSYLKGKISPDLLAKKLILYAKLSINLRAQVNLVKLFLDLNMEHMVKDNWEWLTTRNESEFIFELGSNDEFKRNPFLKKLMEELFSKNKSRLVKVRDAVISKVKPNSEKCNLI